MGRTLNCMATSSASSSLFFLRCGSVNGLLSSFRQLPARPRRFLLCCSSTSFERTISSLSRLLWKSPCPSDTSPRSYRSNSHSAAGPSPEFASRAVAGLSSLNSFCFFRVAKSGCCYIFYYWLWGRECGLGGEEGGGGRCGGASVCGSVPRKRANLSAWICFSYLRRLIWRESSMRELTAASCFSADYSCCSRSSSLHRRQKFWLKTSTRSLRSSSTSVTRLLMKRPRCFSSGWLWKRAILRRSVLIEVRTFCRQSSIV